MYMLRVARALRSTTVTPLLFSRTLTFPRQQITVPALMHSVNVFPQSKPTLSSLYSGSVLMSQKFLHSMSMRSLPMRYVTPLSSSCHYSSSAVSSKRHPAFEKLYNVVKEHFEESIINVFPNMPLFEKTIQARSLIRGAFKDCMDALSRGEDIDVNQELCLGKHRPYGATLLKLAICLSDFEAVKKLVKIHKVNVNQRSTTGETALYTAVFVCHGEILPLVINELIEKNRLLPAVLYCEENRIRMKIVKFLIEEGADVNLGIEKDGRILSSPLGIAVLRKDREIIESLLEAGADVALLKRKIKSTDLDEEYEKFNNLLDNWHELDAMRKTSKIVR